MKFLAALAAVLGYVSAQACPHDLETACVHDATLAYEACDAAAKEQGKDVSADLECMKYFSPLEKECWLCICQIASAENWKIKGCKQLRK